MPLTHLDDAGNARMVDISHKAATVRTATAEGFVRLNEAAREAIYTRTAKKGDVLTIAQLAAIQGAKRTPDLIPLCHPIGLTGVDVRLTLVESGVRCEATCRTTGPTGVEMEALTATTVALLTVIDMLKAVDRGMVIDGVRLLAKSGGASGDYQADR